MAVTGPVAAVLGDLARNRWQRATDNRLPCPGPVPEGSRQRHGLQFDLEDADVAIVRTIPAMDDGTEVREVERLYLDAIAAACDTIYIENQYFTAGAVARALQERLGEAAGPEVILNLPLRRKDGWPATPWT